MIEPQKYRKKPVTVEAMYHNGTEARAYEIIEWIDANFRPHGSAVFDTLDDSIVIKTLEGNMSAGPGWWVIRGVEGEFYPCRGDIFTATYEPAEDLR